MPTYMAKRTPSDVAKAPSPQRHKLYVYVLSVFGRQNIYIYIYFSLYIYLYAYLCQYDLPTPRASIREVRVQEERRCGATGIPPLQMQGSKVAEQAPYMSDPCLFVAAWLCQGEALLTSCAYGLHRLRLALCQSGSGYAGRRSLSLLWTARIPRNATSSFLWKNAKMIHSTLAWEGSVL